MKRNAFYRVMVCIMLFANSCVFEDVSECFYGLQLNFVSTLYDAESESNHQPYISSVKVFVFDADSVLCATASGTGECLASDYTLNIPLSPGLYKVMVWGSSSTNFSRSYVTGVESHQVTVGRTRLKDFLLSLKCDADKEVPNYWHPSVSDFDDLYFGMAGHRTSATCMYSIEDVAIPEYNIVKKEIDLMRNTNRLHVSITGAQNLNTNKENIEVYAQGYNGGYLFDNSRNEKIGAVKYAAKELQGSSQIWNFEIRTQRIENTTYAEKPLMLYIYNKANNRIIYTLNVIEVLMGVQNNDGDYIYKNQEAFDRKYIHSIELRTEGGGDNVTMRIFVNGWEIKNIYPAGN